MSARIRDASCGLTRPSSRLRCPCHSTSFSLEGTTVTHQLPIAPPPLPKFQVREINGVIEVFAPTEPAVARIRCRYDRHPVGTAAGRHRARAPGGCARSPAHDVPMEGRRPRCGRTGHAHRCLRTDARRPAQAHGDQRGLHHHPQADRGAGRRAVGVVVGRHRRLGVHVRRRGHAGTALRGSGTPRSNGLGRGSMRPWQQADSINSSTSPRPRESMRACADCCAI